MRQFLVLLKYGLKTFNRSSGRMRRFPSFVLILAASIAFGLPIASIFFEMFKVLSSFPIEKYDLSSLLAMQWSLVSGFLFLVSFIPNLVSSFVRNEELQLLLALPIRRWAIVSYQMCLTLLLQPLPVVLYVFVLPAYALARGKHPLFGLMSAVLFTMMLLSLSVLLSCFVGLFLSRSTAKRLTVVSLIVTVVIFLMVSQFLPTYAKELLNSDVHTLTLSLKRFIHPLNIFGWPVKAIDEPLYVFFMLLFSFSLSIASVQVSEWLTFEQKSFAQPAKKISFSGGGLFWKDFKLLFRSEQSIFTLIYPVVFGILLAIVARSFVPALLMVTIISGTYVSYSAASLTKQELSCWPLPATFPVSELQLFLPKLFIPSFVYSVIFAGMLVFFHVWFSLPIFAYILLPFVFILYSFASTLGTFFYLKQPTKVELVNPSRVLNPTKILTIQGLILLISSISILPIFSEQFQSLLFMIFKSTFFVTSLICALPIVFCATMILLIKKLIKRIGYLFRRIE